MTTSKEVVPFFLSCAEKVPAFQMGGFAISHEHVRCFLHG
jgi:hypothetical protein